MRLLAFIIHRSRLCHEKEIKINAPEFEPIVTRGTFPQAVAPISASASEPVSECDTARRGVIEHSISYMGLAQNQKSDGLKLDKVFIGPYTNARIEDLRAVANHIKFACHVYAVLVPGSRLITA